VLSRFSAEKRVSPPKNAFLRRKTRLSSEKRVFPMKIVFYRRKTRLSALVQDNPAGLSCPRKETRCPPRTPPFEVFRANVGRRSSIHLPGASFITRSSRRRASVTITIYHA